MQINTPETEIEGLDRDQLESDLKEIAQRNPEGVVLFALRAAFRVLPLLCDEKGFLFKSNRERHFLACWRCIWIGFHRALNLTARTAAHTDARTATATATATAAVDAVDAVYYAYFASADNAATFAFAASAVVFAADAARKSGVSIVADIGDELDNLKRTKKSIDNDKIASRSLWVVEKNPEIERRIALLEKELEERGYQNIAEDYRRFLAGSVSEILKQGWDKYESQWGKVEQEFQANQPSNEMLKASNKKTKPTKKKPEPKPSVEKKPDISEKDDEPQGLDENSVELGKAKEVINHRPGHTYHNDNPVNTDHLNREPMAESIAKWMLAKENNSHLTLGLFGDWGVGKSTFVELIYKHLGIKNSTGGGLEKETPDSNKQETDALQSDIEYLKGEFNAWRYEHSGNIQAGLAQEAINALTKGLSTFQRIKLTWQFAIRQNRNGLIYVLSCLLAAIALITWTILNVGDNYKPWVVLTEIGVAFVMVYQQSKQLLAHPLAKELNTYLRLPDFGEHLGTIPVMLKQIKTLAELRLKPKEGKHRLLFVVDDLDRCSPEAVVKTLEAVRLVMDIDQVMVIIAIDKRIALASLALHYEKLSDHHGSKPIFIARDYLAKVIHVPLTLEDPSSKEVDNFLKNHLWENDETEEAPSDDEEAVTSLGQKKGIDDVLKTKQEDLKDNSEQPPKNVKDKEVNPKDTTDSKVINESVKPFTGNQVPVVAPTIRYGMSEQQREVFLQWVKRFGICNPRQLKRLDNAYRLLRIRYEDEDSLAIENAGQFPRLKMLLWLEYVNELPMDRRDLLRGHWCKILNDNEQPNRKDLALYQEISQAIGDQSEIDKIYRQVKAFVLPVVDKEDLVKVELDN